MPLYYQVVQNLSVAESGLALIPVIVLTTPGSMVSGRAMMHLRHYKISPYIGMSLTTAAAAALVVWPDMPLAWVILATGIIGFGVGSVFPVATVSIQNAVDPHTIGTATGAMNFFRALVSAVVVAIMGAILLAGFGVTPERGGAGLELTAVTAGAAGAGAAEIFRLMFAAALVVSVLSLLAVIFLEERTLHGPPAKVRRETADPVPAE
jgi:MFS family permease